MALAAATVWEVRTTGSDTACSGAFNSARGGTDRSQADSAYKSGTNLTIDATTATDVAPDGYTPDAVADPGNIIQITSGLTAGFYEIVSIQSGKWRLDRAPGSVGASGGVWALGGALASPAKPLAAVVAGNTIWVKAGTYSISSTSANVAGGILNFNVSGSATARIRMRGYTTTRGDSSTRPLLQATATFGSAANLITLNNANSYCSVENLSLDCNTTANLIGLALTGRCNNAIRCKVANAAVNGILLNTNAAAYLCEVTGCTGGNVAAFSVNTSNASIIWGCTSHDNAARGFDVSATAVLHACLSYANTGSNGYGFMILNANANACVNCVAYGNAQDGFYLQTANSDLTCINCLAVSNTGFGFNHSSAQHDVRLFNCAGYANTAGAYPTSGSTTPYLIENYGALSAAPFTNAAGGDFSLNTTAGGGAACRAAGIPGALPGGVTTGYPDLGAAQHADPASGGGGSPVGPSFIKGVH